MYSTVYALTEGDRNNGFGSPVQFHWDEDLDIFEIWTWGKVSSSIPGWMILEFVGSYLNGKTQEMLDNMSGTEFLRFITAEALD